MSLHSRFLVVVASSIFAAASPALAGFVGQTILGPLSAGTSVFDTTSGATDLNDGWDSGTHLFDIWNGGDRVYGLDWAGGDIHLTLTSFGGSDNDLFLYTPSNLDTASGESYRGSFDSIDMLGASAGFYYIIVDSTEFSEGDFQLEVGAVPSPGVVTLFGLSLLGGRRRNRRALN